MRKLLFVVAGVVGAVFVLAAATLLLVDVNQFREPIRAQLEKRLGRSVNIGKLGLKLIPLSIRLDDVAIGESPKFASTAPFVAAKEMFVSVGLGALLRKQVNVESLRVVQPAVELIKDAGGQWNFSTLGGSQPATGDDKSSAGTRIGIASLLIEDGHIAVTDLQQKKPRAVYDHIDLTLKDLNPGNRFSFDADVHLPAKGTETITVHVSGVTPAVLNQLADGDFDGNLSLNAVSLTGLEAFLGSTPSDVAKSVFNGKLELQSRAGTLNGKGAIEISEPRLKQPARIQFEVREDVSTGILTAPSVTVALGGLSASGNATVQTKQTPVVVNAEIRTANAAVADVLNLAAAFGAVEGISGTGTVSLDARISGPANALVYGATGSLRDAKLTLESLRKPVEIQTVTLNASKDSASLDNLSAGLGSTHLKGNLTVRNFAHPDLQFTADIDRLDTAELQQIVVPPAPAKPGARAPSKGAAGISGSGTISVGTLTYNQIALTNVKATCKLDNGVIRLDPISAKLFGGDQAGSIAVDTRTEQTAFDVKAKVNNVDANKLVSATTSLKQILFGMLVGDLDVHAKPRPGQEVAQALNGTVKVQLNNGKLRGLQLMNEIASVGKFLGYARSNDTFTNIVKLAGTLNILNGVASTNDLQLQFDGGSLAAAGTMGLADQSLNMKVTTILPKEFSQRAGGGSQIAGLMSTVLANGKGELVIPAIVSGTFQKPRFEPDTARIAKMKLDGLLPTHDNPLGAVSRIQGLVGAFTGAKARSQLK